jgi:hypothetical protein
MYLNQLNPYFFIGLTPEPETFEQSRLHFVISEVK